MGIFTAILKRNAARKGADTTPRSRWISVSDLSKVVTNPNDMFSDEDIFYTARNVLQDRNSPYFDRYDLIHESADRGMTEIDQELVLHLVTEGKLTLKEQKFAELIAEGDSQKEVAEFTTWVGKRMEKAGLACENKGRDRS